MWKKNQPGDYQKLRNFYDEGNNEYNKGKYELAIPKYNEAIKLMTEAGMADKAKSIKADYDAYKNSVT